MGPSQKFLQRKDAKIRLKMKKYWWDDSCTTFLSTGYMIAIKKLKKAR